MSSCGITSASGVSVVAYGIPDGTVITENKVNHNEQSLIRKVENPDTTSDGLMLTITT